MNLAVNWNPSIETRTFADNGKVPNSKLPVVFYRSAVFIDGRPGLEDVKVFLSGLVKHNGWYVDWVEPDAVLRDTHYHSTAHELLIVLHEVATIEFGGRGGEIITMKQGDAVAIPAGVAHRRATGNADFTVAGLYPLGQKWDTLRSLGEHYMIAEQNLPHVALPKADPLYGRSASAPLVEHWSLR